MIVILRYVIVFDFHLFKRARWHVAFPSLLQQPFSGTDVNDLQILPGVDHLLNRTEVIKCHFKRIKMVLINPAKPSTRKWESNFLEKKTHKSQPEKPSRLSRKSGGGTSKTSDTSAGTVANYQLQGVKFSSSKCKQTQNLPEAPFFQSLRHAHEPRIPTELVSCKCQKVDPEICSKQFKTNLPKRMSSRWRTHERSIESGKHHGLAPMQLISRSR